MSGSVEGKAVRSSDLSQKIESLFDRSQGIQALRDGMYRLCEARSNGFIDNEVFERNLTHLVGTLNFVVPIELCTEMASRLGKSEKISIDVCVEKALAFGTIVLRSGQDAIELAMAREQLDLDILQFQEYLRVREEQQRNEGTEGGAVAPKPEGEEAPNGPNSDDAD